MVKIKLKTLANKTFDADLDDNQTIESVKQYIHETHALGSPDTLKLIYTGKVLKDDQTVGSAKIKEGGFIVVMVSKKKDAPAPASAAAAAPAPAPAPAPAASSPAASSSSPAAPSAESPAANAAAVADTGFVRGPAYETAVESLMALGFERDLVVRALQASFNNPDRAAEFLFNGNVPDHPPQHQSQAPQGASDEHADLGAGPSGGGIPIDIATIQQMLQERPELLDALIAQISQTHPQLMEALGNNRQAFAQLVQNPAMLAQILQAAGLGGPISAGGAAGQGENVIEVTQEDRQAIERLEGLGFSRDRVLEAYLACDRNEEIAANYLFEHGNEPDSDD